MTGAAQAADKTIVVGYQTDALPSSVGIANGDFDKATGAKIDFRRFNSGAEIFAAIASGDVQVGYVGSSPFAAATSRGLDVKAFYLASISGVDEALVVRNGSGINSLADLKGKKLAAAPVSTDHYQLLALIKSLGLNEKDVQVFAIPQPDIVAGYNRGDLDGGFVWDPALTELKKNGKVLVTSKEVAEKGAPTFSAWVATAAFAKENPGFLKAFAGVIDKYQTSFANDKAAWGPDSDNAKVLAKLLGGTPQNQASALKNLTLLPVDVAAFRPVAWRRREVRARQDPEGHLGLPQGSEEDLRRPAFLRRVRHDGRRGGAQEARNVSPSSAGASPSTLAARQPLSTGNLKAHAARRQSERLLCRPRRADGARARSGLARHSRSRIRGRARRLGLREVDAAQRHGGVPAALVGFDRAQRRRGHGPRRRSRRRLPEGCFAALEDGRGECRARAQVRGRRPDGAPRPRAGACCAWSACRTSPTRRLTNCRAACASASASPARSPPTPPSCSWTSRSARSTA